MSKRDHILLAIVAAAAAGVFSAGLRSGIHQYSDFTQIWAASRAYLHGANPYRAVGPGTPFDWDFVLPYPFPAVLVGAPFALLPWRVADVLFVMVSAGLLAFALRRRSPLPSALFPLIAPPTIYALALSQWSPLLTGAALLPAAGWLLACKPTIGAAYAAAWPSKPMLIGVAVFTTISVLLRPSWIGEWWTNIRTLTHPVAPILLPGGFLVAAALWRWRRAEARLLVALACVPQTALLYETVPLALVPQTRNERIAFWLLSIVAYAGHALTGVKPSYVDSIANAGTWIVWAMYLPCVVMILRRPNVFSDAVNPTSTSAPSVR